MTTQTNYDGPNKSSEEVLISRRQLATRWGISIGTLKRRERQGTLTSVRFNRRLVRYRLSTVVAIEAAAENAI